MPNRPRRPGAPPPDPADAGRGWGPSPGYLAAAAGIVAAGLAFGLMSSPSAPPDAAAGNRATAPVASASGAADRGSAGPAPPTAAGSSAGPASADPQRPIGPVAPARPVAASGQAPSPTASIARQRDPNGDPTPDLADYVNAGEQPTMAEVIDRLHQAGVRSGLGAFSPPGTRPPLIGLAVPDDFPLPDGYVRHHQATDDGQRIEAILMFAPDRPVLDAQGRPIAIPPDRVVPPELAPPGLPIRRIVVPAPVEPGRPAR